jgi:hypothetical protein
MPASPRILKKEVLWVKLIRTVNPLEEKTPLILLKIRKMNISVSQLKNEKTTSPKQVLTFHVPHS